MDDTASVVYSQAGLSAVSGSVAPTRSSVLEMAGAYDAPEGSVAHSSSRQLQQSPRRGGALPALGQSPGRPRAAGAYDHYDSPRCHVGTAQYLRPATSPSRKHILAGGDGAAAAAFGGSAPTAASSPMSARLFKTEQWREKGATRWPLPAEENILKHPHQFLRSEEMVPLQRALENAQKDIPSELWTRSLRLKSLAKEEVAARSNQNLACTHLAMTFSRDGQGWSGSTNPKKQVERPPTREWIERPVATGNMSLDHMRGSRYEMRMTPRDCVPHSMEHLRGGRKLAPLSAR
mmetsp:Transcript_75401/g.164500  ORF Transcript_75401/g.164500 Transcript_75401/m.164500 type:complete len:291 (-) Transcript_75401:250-1122(-)